jgi:hypothetical protein
VELDALTSAVEDHAVALDTRDTGIVAALLDELLQEQGLHVRPQRRREFALALLKARSPVAGGGALRGPLYRSAHAAASESA